MMPMNNQAAAMIQSMVRSNPRARQFLQMFQGKTNQEKEQMVRNMCKERGTTPEDLARSLGLPLR